jgi:hypothetical protein
MRKTILMMLLVVMSGSVTAESAKDALFAKVVAGAECKQDVSNGLLCSYKVGKRLHIGIKDAGGNDPVISFRHSDWDDDFYAVMYFGCIVVVPGTASKEKYEGDGIYIAPKNGRVFRTRSECQAANK